MHSTRQHHASTTCRRISAAVLLLVTLALSGRTAEPLLRESFNAGSALPEGAVCATADGIAGPYAQLRDVIQFPRTPLPAPLIGDYTLAAWIRAAEWLEGGDSGFGQRTPATIMALSNSSTFAPVVFRVHRRSLQLAVNCSGRWDHADAWHELPTGEWLHAVVVRQGPVVRFFLNGVEELATRLHRVAEPLQTVRIASLAERTFFGDIDEVNVWDRALTDEEVAALVPPEYRERVAGFSAYRPVPKRPAFPGRELVVRPGDTSPLIGGLSPVAVPLPWFGPGRCDLLCHGVLFNAHPTIHRRLRDGTYAPGVPLAELVPDAGLPEPPFFRIDRADGLFDLISTGGGTPIDDHLLLHRNTGRAGAPSFAAPVSIRCDGAVFRSAYSARVTAVRDIDGDLVPDLLLVKSHKGAPYTPDHPHSFWTGAPHPSTGKGRGYSINGRWLGHEGRHKFHWAKGERRADGTLAFGPLADIVVGDTDFPLQWKGYGTPTAAWFEHGGNTWLVLQGDVDRILAVPARVEGDRIRCGPPCDLLRDSARLRLLYYPRAMQAYDVDQDDAEELVLCGNPGVVVILDGPEIGRFEETAALQKGGALAMETLIVPCRVDWDGDGHQDIVAGDASGWLKLWPGTADSTVYRSPVPMRTPSGPVHSQAGYSGSIQGPNEARWGYLNPTTGDWDLDGRHDIITCDINADMLWFRPGDRPGLLDEPVRITHGADKLRVAWRQRPAILPPSFGIAGNRPVLLHMNWDGILSLGIPEQAGAAEIAEVRELTFIDDRPVKLDGPGGLWGRAKFAVTDWDHDGVWDVIFGTNRSDNKFFSEECARKGAMPFLLRNAGTPSRPVFEHPVPIKLGSEYLTFCVHVAAVCPTDMDGDGHDDLLVGAEDGRIYRFLRHELTPAVPGRSTTNQEGHAQ